MKKAQTLGARHKINSWLLRLKISWTNLLVRVKAGPRSVCEVIFLSRFSSTLEGANKSPDTRAPHSHIFLHWLAGKTVAEHRTVGYQTEPGESVCLFSESLNHFTVSASVCVCVCVRIHLFVPLSRLPEFCVTKWACQPERWQWTRMFQSINNATNCTRESQVGQNKNISQWKISIQSDSPSCTFYGCDKWEGHVLIPYGCPLQISGVSFSGRQFVSLFLTDTTKALKMST